MKNKIVLILAVCGVVIAGLLVWTAITSSQLNTARHELSDTQNQLSATQLQLTDTASRLLAVNNELDDTKTKLALKIDQLTGTQTALATKSAELNTVKLDLAGTITRLASTSAELTTTQQSLTAKQTVLTQTQQSLTTKQTALTQTRQQLTSSQNALRGLGITLASSIECDDVVLVDNPQAVDPTFAQLMTFLAQDTTENNKYILNVYDCSQFSRDVHNRAETAGIRSAEVQVWFSNSITGHALDAFLTTDYGLVYVDCTAVPDSFARVKVYKTYRGDLIQDVPPLNIRNDVWWDSLKSYHYIATENGTQAIVESITIYW